MKKNLCLHLFIFFVYLMVFSVPAESKVRGALAESLSGSYLGQLPPSKKPEIFGPGIVSTFMREGNLVVTPDGKEIFFSVYTESEGTKKQLVGTIVTIREENGIWTDPEVASFSGIDSDGYITMHPDGHKMFFNSNRKTNRDDLRDEWNIWYVERTENGWGEARPMEPPVNGSGNVSCFSVSKNNNGYFTKMNADWQKIYRSKYSDGKYQEPEELPSNVNSVTTQFDSYISPDETFLIVPVYNRKDSIGETDLYVSFRDLKDHWSPLVNLGPLINTAGMDGSATISADGKYVFISSHREENRSKTQCRTYNDLLRSHCRPVISHGIVHNINDVYWFDAGYISELNPR